MSVLDTSSDFAREMFQDRKLATVRYLLMVVMRNVNLQIQVYQYKHMGVSLRGTEGAPASPYFGKRVVFVF